MSAPGEKPSDPRASKKPRSTNRGQIRFCHVCEKGPGPDHLDGITLRMIRTVIGVRQGRFRTVPVPEFAAMLGISRERLRRYERDQEKIPRDVAQAAKRLRHIYAPMWRVPGPWMRGLKARIAARMPGQNSTTRGRTRCRGPGPTTHLKHDNDEHQPTRPSRAGSSQYPPSRCNSAGSGDHSARRPE